MADHIHAACAECTGLRDRRGMGREYRRALNRMFKRRRDEALPARLATHNGVPGIARQIKRLRRVDARSGARSVGYPALAAEYESTVTQFLTIKVYCTNIGDAGVPDVPHPSEDMDGATEAASRRLAYNFKSKKGSKEKPTQSILVNDKNRVLARFRMTQQGLERVEIGIEYAD